MILQFVFNFRIQICHDLSTNSNIFMLICTILLPKQVATSLYQHLRRQWSNREIHRRGCGHLLLEPVQCTFIENFQVSTQNLAFCLQNYVPNHSNFNQKSIYFSNFVIIFKTLKQIVDARPRAVHSRWANGPDILCGAPGFVEQNFKVLLFLELDFSFFFVAIFGAEMNKIGSSKSKFKNYS